MEDPGRSGRGWTFDDLLPNPFNRGYVVIANTDERSKQIRKYR